jgi:hypothetical protein
MSVPTDNYYEDQGYIDAPITVDNSLYESPFNTGYNNKNPYTRSGGGSLAMKASAILSKRKFRTY